MPASNSTSYSKTGQLPFKWNSLFEIINDFYLCLVKKLLLLQVEDSLTWLMRDKLE